MAMSFTGKSPFAGKIEVGVIVVRCRTIAKSQVISLLSVSREVFLKNTVSFTRIV